MNQHTSTRYLNGFIVGVVLGLLLIIVGTSLNNLFCSWRGCPPMTYTFWNLALFPLLLGISMAIFVANYTLRD